MKEGYKQPNRLQSGFRVWEIRRKIDGEWLTHDASEAQSASRRSCASPHDFRRAFAIEGWRAGLDILTISQLMGHTSLQVLNR